MVLNLFSELAVFVIHIIHLVLPSPPGFCEDWENMCKVLSTESCAQLIYSSCRFLSSCPCCFLLFFILCLVLCLLLIFLMRLEAPQGRLHTFYFLVTFTALGRGYSAVIHSQGFFLSILFFSIFQSWKYQPSFTGLSPCAKHSLYWVLYILYLI